MWGDLSQDTLHLSCTLPEPPTAGKYYCFNERMWGKRFGFINIETVETVIQNKNRKKVQLFHIELSLDNMVSEGHKSDYTASTISCFVYKWLISMSALCNHEITPPGICNVVFHKHSNSKAGGEKSFIVAAIKKKKNWEVWLVFELELYLYCDVWFGTWTGLRIKASLLPIEKVEVSHVYLYRQDRSVPSYIHYSTIPSQAPSPSCLGPLIA